MNITLDEAIKMYARVCQARYGENASAKVKATARQLEKKGDLEGHRVWNQVARELDNALAKDSDRLN